MGKISYSQFSQWDKCPQMWKLNYVDKVGTFTGNIYTIFGTAVHEGCESLVEKKTPNREKLILDIRNAWEEHGFDDPEWVSKQPGWYKYAPVDEWVDWANNMWDDIPAFLDKEFPGWETVKAEEELYEDIEGFDIKFKGFIDAVIKVPNKKFCYKFIVF